MKKRSKGKARRDMGLLPGGGVRSEAATEGADQRPAGRDHPPAPRTAEIPGQETPQVSGIREKKQWQNPCHFSCVPYQFRPVDVYCVTEVPGTAVQE